MTVFRDWPRSLRPASYRGVPFYVERDQIETGRRLVVHEFPLKETPYVEDLGRDTNKISVTAYVVGDRADSAEQELRRACERGGRGSLSLPMDRMEAHCESCSRDFAKDKLGFIAFSLKFVREGDGFGGALPAAFMAAQIGVAAGQMVAAVSAWLPLVLKTNGAGLLRDRAAAEVRAVVATIVAMARSLTLDADLGPAVATGLNDISRRADSLVKAVATPHTITLTSFAEARTSTGAEALGPALAAVLETLRLAVVPDIGAAAMADLASYAVPPPVVPLRTPTRRQAEANAEAVAKALRLLALAAYAEAVAARTFTDRRAAIQARADAAEFFAAETDTLSPGPGSAELARTLLALSARVAEHLSRRVADLAPVLTLEAPLAMPSLWWACRLYGGAPAVGTAPQDLSVRATDLVARNRVIHASFLPPVIEALAR